MLDFNLKKCRAKLPLLLLAALLTGSLVYAGSLISSQYIMSLSAVTNSVENAASPGYKIEAGRIGQSAPGNAESPSYQNAGGFAAPVVAMANPPAQSLSDAYVYPNPFKPNSPGSFQADKLTFKHLPAEATIRIFAITGRQVAELHKTDSTVDYYEWPGVNSDGRKLASGVYIFYMTSPGGGKSKGKFAVIR